MFFGAGRDDAFELVVVGAQDANVTFKFRDVPLLHRQEAGILVDLAGDDALFGVGHLARRDVLEVSSVDQQLVHGLRSLVEGLGCLWDLFESLQVVCDALY